MWGHRKDTPPLFRQPPQNPIEDVWRIVRRMETKLHLLCEHMGMDLSKPRERKPEEETRG